MQNNTRNQFDGLLQLIHSSNGLGTITNAPINYVPAAQQNLYSALGEQADLLKQINQIPVTAQIGQRVGLGISRPIASRTNTEDDDKERKTRDVVSLNPDEYHCKQTNFDTHVGYGLMDSLAHAGNFAEAYTKKVITRVACDTLMIAFNGKTAAKDTDLAANPMLQDVNIGWLEKTRKNDPARILGCDSTGQATEDQFKVGEGGKYNTLDALVFDIVSNLLDPWHQAGDDLLVMVGREVWVNHGMELLSNSTLPTERNALQTWFANKTVAGLPCVMPPFIPARSIIVTSYDNLSVYHQLDTLRRNIVDNPKKDRVEEYISENQAYVVEDYGKLAAVRDGALLLPDGQGGWA